MADYFSNFVEYFPRLMEGLKLTIIIAIFGILLAVALGIILCIFSISNSRILQKIASVYITIIRGMLLHIWQKFSGQVFRPLIMVRWKQREVLV